MSSSSFHPILDAALADYNKKVDIDLATHPDAANFRSCASPDAALNILEEKAKEFKEFREGNRKLINWIKPVVHIVYTFSSVISASLAFVPFKPANAVFVGISILMVAASGVSSSYDALIDLFECLGNFLKRVRIYNDIPLSPSMKEITVKIMVELLSVLALATKQVKMGRLKKFAMKLLGEKEIEGILRRLDRLTQDEGRMTVAQTLEVVYGLVNNVEVVINDGKASVDGIWKSLDMMQQIAIDVNKIKRDRLQRESRSWLCPPDPSPNYNAAQDIHKDGTSTWFCEGSIFFEWNAKGSLLWIHGKPGSGKTILMSSVIREIDRMRRAGLALMAYFFFDFRDTQKQHRRDLISSLLFQLSARSDACHHIFHRFYSDNDEGAHQPSDDALAKCLTDMLKVQEQPATYLIIDALDESPNSAGTPTPRDKVLQFLEDLVDLQLPNVHICISSRPEIDIQIVLDPLATFRVSLHEENGQMEDISGYIKSFVHSDRNMRRWSPDNKKLVIDTLSEKADGMFRWVYCLLDILRRCFPSSLHAILEQLPETLDETYEHTLLRIDKVRRQFAHRLLQCLAVSIRPLRVEELAEILAIRFNEGGAIPEFNTSWRLGDAEEAVLSACSSLITVVNVKGSRIVQFAHFSVKEFLTSDRLATAGEDLSRYHITPHLAHATLAQACLGVLLGLDDRIDSEGTREFPLADYAARYWFEHGRIENVSATIREATLRLFDREKSHFSAWVWVYDLDDPWRNSMPTKHPERPEASPLYYAVHCRLRWLVDHLIATSPRDFQAKGGYFTSPWIVAFEIGDIELACMLLRFGADVTALNARGKNPLHDAALRGRADTVCLLLECNVDVNIFSNHHETPLSVAASVGSSEVARILIQNGANVDSRNVCDWTPLLEAADNGHLDVVRLLTDSGAVVNLVDDEGKTSLHHAALNGHLDVVKLLLENGVDFNVRSADGKTALDLASDNEKLDVANFLSEYVASAIPPVTKPSSAILQAQSNPPGTVQAAQQSGDPVNDAPPPLYTASKNGQLDIVRSLLDQGSDPNETSRVGSRHTALYAASAGGKLEVAQLLIERGAFVNVRSRGGATPLHYASTEGNLEISRLLLDHGADSDARTRHGWTALHLASGNGHLRVAQFLVERGADVFVRNPGGRTPGQEAKANGRHKVAEFLSESGTDGV